MSDPQMIVLTPKRGRPRRSLEASTKRIALFVTPDEHAQLKQVAAETRRPLSSLIRDAVNEFVSDYKDIVVFTPSGDTFKRD